MGEIFMIKHRSSGKFFHPSGGRPNPANDTPIVLHSAIHDRMFWTFVRITEQWGYIKHVSSGKYIHPSGGSIKPKENTKLVLHSATHWGALFALSAVDHLVYHKSLSTAKPKDGKPNPPNETGVVLSYKHNAVSEFEFVSTKNPREEVLIYGTLKLLGTWKILSMVKDPKAKHVLKLEVKIGRSKTQTSEWGVEINRQIGFEMKSDMISFNSSASVKLMFNEATSETFSEEITKTTEITVEPGKTVVTWQYVFDVTQEGFWTKFGSNMLADTDNELNPPSDNVKLYCL